MNSYYKIKGYLDLLCKSPPNGRLSHDRGRLCLLLELYLRLELDIPEHVESELKAMVRELYPEPRKDIAHEEL